jgi:hypothetical protein
LPRAGSVLHADGWPGYSGLTAKGYVYEVTIIQSSKRTASELLPRFHRVISSEAMAERWTILNLAHADL